MEKQSNNFQDGAFKLPRLKSLSIKEEVEKAIRYHAKMNMDNLYSEGISDEIQCSGYHAFRALVLMKEPLPKIDRLDSILSIAGNTAPGFYLLSRLHPLIRLRALECAKEIRKTFKICNNE